LIVGDILSPSCALGGGSDEGGGIVVISITDCGRLVSEASLARRLRRKKRRMVAVVVFDGSIMGRGECATSKGRFKWQDEKQKQK
jgi:hypothetical protein